MNNVTTTLFYDSEFTGLTKKACLISMGFVTETGNQTFYAEFSDYKRDGGVDDWIQNNVLAHCLWINRSSEPFVDRQDEQTQAFGDSQFVRAAFLEWLQQFDKIEIWADCNAYDWVLFCDLFGGALSVPENIHYMPGELSTLFRLRGLDPDTDRLAFVGASAQTIKHHALNDAKVIRNCYKKLMDT